MFNLNYSQFLTDCQVKTDKSVYNNIMEFTKRFNEVLKTCAKSQTQIAKELNISKQCVNDYKTGKTVPSLQTLYALCKVLDVSADYLLGLTEY